MRRRVLWGKVDQELNGHRKPANIYDVNFAVFVLHSDWLILSCNLYDQSSCLRNVIKP